MNVSFSYFLTFNNNFMDAVYLKTHLFIDISVAWHFPVIKGAVK